jgi:hypothetical protein
LLILFLNPCHLTRKNEAENYKIFPYIHDNILCFSLSIGITGKKAKWEGNKKADSFGLSA